MDQHQNQSVKYGKFKKLIILWLNEASPLVSEQKYGSDLH